ncbi:MAG: Mur ligase family protein, partial [Acidobacteriota bacterium]
MPDSLTIHIIAIGGTGTAPLACLLQAAGHRVRGSDGPLYPPMSTLLETFGVAPFVGFDPAHLEPAPDLVVVGNAVPRSNPEAEAVEASGLTRISMPEAIGRFFLDGRRPLVAAGTHGKTTTTAIAAWVYSVCGRDPGYLIGGVPIGLDRSFARGTGARFVIEGDEYNAAYFDRGAKFLHYRPETLLLTSVEYDHADLYPSHDALLDAFRALVRLVPEGGAVVACADGDADAGAAMRAVLAAATASVITYGLSDDDAAVLDVRAGAIDDGPAGVAFTVHDRLDGAPRATRLRLQLSGHHNVRNALAVWTAARRDGLAPDDIAAALARFRGVQRRLEVLGEAAGVTVVDDFAHHPTAVAAGLQALGRRFPGRRRVVLFEPRSLTAGQALHDDAYRR